MWGLLGSNREGQRATAVDIGILHLRTVDMHGAHSVPAVPATATAASSMPWPRSMSRTWAVHPGATLVDVMVVHTGRRLLATAAARVQGDDGKNEDTIYELHRFAPFWGFGGISTRPGCGKEQGPG